ncbi:peroxiredoxin [Marinihelvus fidelis]|uniref:thioredoxin-dependent peroxiredoxin n=1 Tax=Marinihelvus fidelis TaxID=2613842 RepID=A0A5N0T4K5_9GAMM|nr:peroxiredoxin [Marinihelvus fidelis]KAA9129781.1 peroxiredoxin [Marinihelvus fidelis]
MFRKALAGIVTLAAGLFAVVASAGEPPAVGSAAPDFRLQDQNGEWHELADYQGQWLAVYFYPKDDTPGCTTEACNFRDNIYQFQAIDAAVVGISVDDVDSHKAFATKYKLPFTLLADQGGEVSGRYGVLRDFKLMKLASRQTFLVDPQGNVAKHYDDVDPDTHTQDVLADIQSLRGDAGS